MFYRSLSCQSTSLLLLVVIQRLWSRFLPIPVVLQAEKKPGILLLCLAAILWLCWKHAPRDDKRSLVTALMGCLCLWVRCR